MAATTTYNVTLTLGFADSTSRTLTFKGVEETATRNVKSRVNALNYNGGEGMPREVAVTFVSAIGAELVMISKAKVIKKVEEVIYQ